VISLIFARQVRHHHPAIRQSPWYHKTEPTFADALATVRRLLWNEILLKDATHSKGFPKLPPRLRNTVLDFLCAAA